MQIFLTQWAAMLFLPLALLVSAWVMWSDMARMKIPNKAVMVLLIGFAVLGFFALDLSTYLWRWSHFALILVLGFLMNAARMLGAGDAKFAAAIAPFVAVQDTFLVLTIFAAMIVVGFTAHRILRRIKPLRELVPDWESWSRRDYPMGLSICLTFLTYLICGLIYGA
ncbi:prepilin peptidase [Aliiroseovarius sp. S1123]|jgi:prepilin peptidase CpaA|uniref:A24 family peptidase n=1 Tax=unclassified Aliiroseovarius TaxID=2623558 RepID=UPI001FF265A9|nr:prepilin peptidase [Aliiroseovarius sp. S1123]MCK0169955.1 prepilin peptidase [Aliiroseovarius sp. S1123]